MSEQDAETPAEGNPEEKRRKVTHDLRQCLHVIHLGLEVLRDVRDDETRFAEVWDTIQQERAKAMELVDQLSDLAREQQKGS